MVTTAGHGRVSDDGRVPTDELVAAGLYDPAAPDAPDRLALLDHLLAQGCTVDDLVDAEAVGRLTSAAADARVRGGQRPVNLDEVGSLAGVDPAVIARAWRAIGFPDPSPEDRLWWPSDAATFAAFYLGAEMFGEDRLAQAIRRDPGVAPDVLCKSLLEAARDFSSGPLTDDVAILAIRRE